MARMKLKKIEPLPKGCGYMGYEFGATYLDSECFGGQLYDLDNCDDEANLFEPSNYLPCPKCNHREWLKVLLEEVLEDGYNAHSNRLPRTYPTQQAGLKYPKDFRRLRKAWLSGWDLAQAEKVAKSKKPLAISEVLP